MSITQQELQEASEEARFVDESPHKDVAPPFEAELSQEAGVLIVDALTQAVLDRLEEQVQAGSLIDLVIGRVQAVQQEENALLQLEHLLSQNSSFSKSSFLEEKPALDVDNGKDVALDNDNTVSRAVPPVQRDHVQDTPTDEDDQKGEYSPPLSDSSIKTSHFIDPLPDAKPFTRTTLTAELTSLPYLYERVDHGQRTIIFGVDGTIGYGQGTLERFWELVDSGGELLLELYSEEKMTCRFYREGEKWIGEELNDERTTLRLIPLPTPDQNGDEYLKLFLPLSGDRPIFMEALRLLRTSEESKHPDKDVLDVATSGAPVIVEIGSIQRSLPTSQEKDGWSTRCFGWYASAFDAEFHSVDCSRSHQQVCRQAIRHYLPHIHLHLAEGEVFLRDFTGPIDLLYLDAWYESPNMREAQYLDAYRGMARKPRILLLKASEDEGQGDLGRRRLVAQALQDGYRVFLQGSRHLLLSKIGGEIASLVEEEAIVDISRPSLHSLLSGHVPSVRLSPQHMLARPYSLRVASHNRGGFKSLTDQDVLLYWPHGFGDWVFLSYLLPQLNSTNRYHVARFGDDSASLFDGSAFATPLYLGTNSPHCGDGEKFGMRHFGLGYESVDGREQLLSLPLALAEQCDAHRISTMLWSDHPEPFGFTAPPFHSKSRVLLPSLVEEAALAQMPLDKPLPSAINFNVVSWLQQFVESRLSSFCGFSGKSSGRKLCIISRNGYTATGKNWGHLWREDMPIGKQREGEECRDFMRLLLHKDPRWMFLIMEDILFEGDQTVRSEELHAYSYAQVFGSVGTSAPPFGLILKALLNLANLVIGVPTGPYHLSMAKGELPTVGIWLGHLPSWYDEPNPASRHLIGRDVRDRGFHERPGSFDTWEGLSYASYWLDTRVAPGEQVLEAVEDLLYS